MSPQALENCLEAFLELTVPFHDTWWLLVRAEDQALARAAHEASGGAADTFGASWLEEFNTVAGED